MQEFVMEEICGEDNVLCESVGEYTLPDYMPEVRRLLRVSATASVAGQYARGDKYEIGGDTHYMLLYTDPDGKLAAAEEEGTFEGVINLPEGAPMMIYPCVENVSCRLSGPRKLSLRAGIGLHNRAHRCVTVTPPAVGDAAGSVEYLYHPVQVAETHYFRTDDMTLTDSIHCDVGTVPLSTDARVLIREVKCESDTVRVRGEVWVSVLCNTAEGAPVTHRCKLPFEEMIPTDGVTSDHMGIARGDCRRVTCEVSEGTNGADLMADITVTLDGMAVKNETKEVVKDLYATAYEMIPKTDKMTARWYPVAQMANFTVDGSVSREDLGIDEESLRPVDAQTTVVSASCTTDGGAVVIAGDLRVSCILACDVTDGSYRSVNFDLPYRVRVNCGTHIPEGTVLTSDVTCISARARADGARLSIDAELGVMLLGTHSEDCEIILSAEPNPDAPITHPDGEIIAAYLSDGDTLWSIAKRYHTPLADLAHANSLPDGVLEEPDFAQHLDGLTRLIV